MSKSLGISMTGQGCQTPGPQTPGLDPAIGAWRAENSPGLGDKTECGRRWED